MFSAISNKVPPAQQPLVYLVLHALFCLVTLLLSTLCWRSFACHTALLVLQTSASIWHGGAYYFSVFAQRCVRACERVGCLEAAVAAKRCTCLQARTHTHALTHTHTRRYYKNLTPSSQQMSRMASLRTAPSMRNVPSPARNAPSPTPNAPKTD